MLNGVFKTDDMEVKYRLRFIQNNHVWKMLGLNGNDATTEEVSSPPFVIASEAKQSIRPLVALWIASSLRSSQ